MIINRKDLSDPDLVERLITQKSPENKTITFSLGGEEKTVPYKQGILNIVLWYALIATDMEITVDDMFDCSVVSKGFYSDVYTHVYNRLVDNDTLDYDKRRMLIWDSLHKLNYFITDHLRAYGHTLDIFSLIEFRKHPRVAPIVNHYVDPLLGPAHAELELQEKADELHAVITDISLKDVNPLLPLAITGNINVAQLPQIFNAFGTRSDVDTTMKSHIINNSNISGIKGIADYAVESLAGKMAAFLSTSAIKDSNGLGRVLRLVGSAIQTVYPSDHTNRTFDPMTNGVAILSKKEREIIGTPIHALYTGGCGTTLYVPMRVEPKFLPKYEYSTILDGTTHVTLTKKNIQRYENKIVSFVTPFGCSHQDGVCEQCFGWGYGRAKDYLPVGSIGIMVMTWLVNDASQKILSTKHRAITTSSTLRLSEMARKFLFLHQRNLMLVPQSQLSADSLYLRLEQEDMRPLTDLNEDWEEISATFSRVDTMVVTDMKKKEVAEFSISNQANIPFLSFQALKRMERLYKDNPVAILEDKKYIYVPLEIFDRNEPLFDITVMSADMEAFIRKVRLFFTTKSTGIPAHRSVSSMMNAMVHLLWSKLDDITFPALMLIARSMLIDPAGSSAIPIISNANDITPATLNDISETRATSMALAHSQVEGWLEKSTTYTKERGGSGYNDVLGFATTN